MDDLMPGASAAEDSLLADIARADVQAAALFPLQNPNPVLRAAPDGTVLFANRASQSLLNSWGAGAGGRLPDEMQRLIQETLASGKQRRIRLPHGDEVLELDFIPIKDGGYANVYARDVTAQVKAERQAIDALQEANEQLARRVKERTAELEAIFASLPDAVYVGNENGMYLVNQAALDNLGCDGIQDLQDRIPDLAEKVQTRYAASGQRLSPEEEPFARALQGERITLEMILRNLKTGQDIVVRSACAPIVQDGKVIGAVAVNTDITERLRADAELRAHREQLKNLSRRLIELQESERQFIARQLYDDEGQRLAAVLVQLRMLELDPECGPAVLARIADLKNLAAGLLQDLHSLAVDLRPASLDQLGLPHALRQYAQDFGQAHNLQVQSEFVRMDAEHLARDTETAIYRIMQEALANVARHAGASRVDIVVQKRANSVTAIIEDNGVGFDVDEAVREGTLGLVGMRERVESVGGSLAIESVRGSGTTVYVQVPC